MPTPAAKRRRIDAANQALSKPFRSPFKTTTESSYKSPVKDSTPVFVSQSTITSAGHDVLPELANSTTHTKTPLTSKSTNILSIHSSLSAPPSRGSTTTNKTKNFTSPHIASLLTTDFAITPLLKTQRELEKQLRQVNESLDLALQAHKIETDSLKSDPDGDIDGELIELMARWRAASRLAAEELFGKVRDRVNRMGGPRAWKEMQRKQEEWQNGWEGEGNGNGDDGGGEAEDDEEGEGNRDAEKRDIYAEYSIDPETENEKSQREKGVGDTGELPGQEDEFTMAMMLRTLNVDLDVIGYDKLQQRWTD